MTLESRKAQSLIKSGFFELSFIQIGLGVFTLEPSKTLNFGIHIYIYTYIHKPTDPLTLPPSRDKTFAPIKKNFRKSKDILNVIKCLNSCKDRTSDYCVVMDQISRFSIEINMALTTA